MFKAKDMITAFRKHCPELIEPVNNSVDLGVSELDFFKLAPEPWSNCQNISIDYAIMERAQNLVAIPLNTSWTDLGGWSAVWKSQVPDKNGNVTSGPVTTIECKQSLLRSESNDLKLVGIGLSNLAVIAMPDAVLVSAMDKAQDVKNIVNYLKDNGAPQAENFPKDHRPWGYFETLIKDERFQVKRIHVNPGGVLSLQSHGHRSENWVVVEGTATVTVDKIVNDLVAGQSVYIPQGAIHRLENKTDKPLLLIEVQTGNYLGEDDIKRFEDIYSRD